MSAVSICAPVPSRVLNAVSAGPLSVDRVSVNPVLLCCTLGVVPDATGADGVRVTTTGLALI